MESTVRSTVIVITLMLACSLSFADCRVREEAVFARARDAAEAPPDLDECGRAVLYERWMIEMTQFYQACPDYDPSGKLQRGALDGVKKANKYRERLCKPQGSVQLP